MKKQISFLSVFFFVLGALFFASASPAAPLKKINASFTALAYANPPFWIAKDLGLFEKYGLDVELNFVRGTKGISAMAGGSVDVAQIGGLAAVAAAIEGLDVVMLGTVFDRLVFALHASPEIKKIEDLKGKTIGIGNRGANSYFAGLVLMDRMGWVPDKDVHFLSVGNSPAVLSALQQGSVAAGLMAPPTTYKAEELGFKELFDIGTLKVPFPTISVASSRKFIDRNPDTILNVLRATSEAVYIYKYHPELAFPIISKYMKISPDEPGIAKSHALYVNAMNERLTVPMDGIKYVMEQLAVIRQEPEVKNRKTDDFIDTRFLKQLEAEGFFDKLGKK